MSSKRTGWVKSAFSQSCSDANQPAKKSRNCRVTTKSHSSSLRCPNNSTSNCVQLNNKKDEKPLETIALSSNWIETFAPEGVDDLAVHSKKIDELRDWFKHCDVVRRKCPAQICLITGPAGSGKTATVKALASEFKYQLIEWINPVDGDVVSSLGDQKYSYTESQIETFKSFLFRSSRYKAVFESLEKRLILVEDFPNAFVKESDGFTEVLGNYSKYGKSPLVFVVTDSKSKTLNLSYNLFPEAVKNEYRIAHISFNSVAATLMKKALKRICNLMTQESFRKLYTAPAQAVVDSIGLAAQGDIRNALINLHFASLKGAPCLSTESLEATSVTKSSRSRSKPQLKLKSVGRDETITMMHALGRVFNPKYDETKRNLLHPPEQIADAFATEPKNFVNFIHSNYMGHYSNIENVIGAADSLSISDLVLGEYREDQLGVLGLNIAVRGVMVCNETPVSGWIPVRGPKRLDIAKDFEAELTLLGLSKQLSKNLFASDYRSYIKIIQKK